MSSQKCEKKQCKRPHAFHYFRSKSAVAILIFVKAKEKMMSPNTHIFPLVTILNGKNMGQGCYKYIEVTCPYLAILSAVKQSCYIDYGTVASLPQIFCISGVL